MNSETVPPSALSVRDTMAVAQIPPIDDGIEDEVRRLDDAGKLFRLRQLVNRRLQVKLEVRGRYAAILEEFCHNRAHFTSKHHLCLSSRTPYWMPWTVS